jgi:hypothetical protein
MLCFTFVARDEVAIRLKVLSVFRSKASNSLLVRLERQFHVEDENLIASAANQSRITHFRSCAQSSFAHILQARKLKSTVYLVRRVQWAYLDLFLFFASCCVSMPSNDIYLTVYATNFINYTTCFGPNGSSSGVSIYTSSTY